MLAGNTFMMEFGFAMAFGIVLAAFVMAMFFTPALTALIGNRAWWPGHGADPEHGHGASLGAARRRRRTRTACRSRPDGADRLVRTRATPDRRAKQAASRFGGAPLAPFPWPSNVIC